MKFSRGKFKGLYQKVVETEKIISRRNKISWLSYGLIWDTYFHISTGMGTSFWNIITWSKHSVEPHVACFIKHSGHFWEDRKRNKNVVGRISQALELHLHFICFKNKDIYYITKDMEQKWQNAAIWQTYMGKGIVSFLLKTPGLWEEQ